MRSGSTIPLSMYPGVTVLGEPEGRMGRRWGATNFEKLQPVTIRTVGHLIPSNVTEELRACKPRGNHNVGQH
jgi:hypothetical protein